MAVLLTAIRIHHDLLVRHASLRLEKALNILIVLLHGNSKLGAEELGWVLAGHVLLSHDSREGIQDAHRVVCLL